MRRDWRGCGHRWRTSALGSFGFRQNGREILFSHDREEKIAHRRKLDVLTVTQVLVALDRIGEFLFRAIASNARIAAKRRIVKPVILEERRISDYLRAEAVRSLGAEAPHRRCMRKARGSSLRSE